MTTDFNIEDQGTIVVLIPITLAAHDWERENIPQDVPRWGNGFISEHRYADDIVAGIIEDGLTIGDAR